MAICSVVMVENDLESLLGARSERNIIVPRDPWGVEIERKVKVEYIVINSGEFWGINRYRLEALRTSQ